MPDFVDLSFYKMFGFPTGLGCLLARKEAFRQISQERRSFAGGTIVAVSALGRWYRLLEGHERFEEGTQSYGTIPGITAGLDFLQSIGVATIHERVMSLTGWLLDTLQDFTHSNGASMVRIYGPTDTHERGGNVAFNLLDPDGNYVDNRYVILRAGKEFRLCIRKGCFCSPGSGEFQEGLTSERLNQAGMVTNDQTTLDEYLEFLGIPEGAVRVSFGFPNSFVDAYQVALMVQSFRDQVTFLESGEAKPRLTC